MLRSSDRSLAVHPTPRARCVDLWTRLLHFQWMFFWVCSFWDIPVCCCSFSFLSLLFSDPTHSVYLHSAVVYQDAMVCFLIVRQLISLHELISEIAVSPSRALSPIFFCTSGSLVEARNPIPPICTVSISRAIAGSSSPGTSDAQPSFPIHASVMPPWSAGVE